MKLYQKEENHKDSHYQRYVYVRRNTININELKKYGLPQSYDVTIMDVPINNSPRNILSQIKTKWYYDNSEDEFYIKIAWMESKVARKGHGTYLLEVVSVFIEEVELANSIEVKYIIGDLSSFYKKDDWDKGINFYKKACKNLFSDYKFVLLDRDKQPVTNKKMYRNKYQDFKFKKTKHI